MSKIPMAVLVAVLLLAACNSSDAGSETVSTAPAAESTGSDGSQQGEAAEAQSAEDPEPAEAPASDGGEQASSGDSGDSGEPSMNASTPIGAFFADDGGFEAALEEYRVRVEEEIVVCMAEQGFEFALTGFEPPEIERLQNELTVREWTERFGYGISTSFESFVQSQAADPNADIIFSLSPAEREAWIETLTGGEDLFNDRGSIPLEEQGCVGAALIATGGGDAIEGLEEFGEAYEEAEEALDDRREMVDAVDAWSRCMSEAGYPDLSQADDAQDLVRNRFNEVTAPLQAAMDRIDPEAGRALVEGDSIELEELPDLDVDALREVQAEELAIAATDLDCYEQHVKSIYEPLRDEFERGLMSEYQSELDAMRNIGS